MLHFDSNFDINDEQLINTFNKLIVGSIDVPKGWQVGGVNRIWVM